jgi:transposase
MSRTSTEVVMGQEMFAWFVGVDWGTVQHAIAVSDATGRVLTERTVVHTSDGLARFVDWLGEVSGGHLERVAVAIEVPRGAIVELLLERGAAVFALNPKQLDRFRDRFSVAGAKDDALDARVLSSAVRTDRARFRRLTLDEPLVIRVRELTRAVDVLQAEHMALTNRLRELVHRIAPEWLTLSTNADDPWFWTLLEHAAQPALGRHLRRGKIQRLLKSFRIRRVTADDVLPLLRRPPLTLAPGTVDAVTAHIQLLLPRVRLVAEQRAACERELIAVLADLTRVDPAAPSQEAGSDASGPTAPGASSPPSPPSDVAILQSVPGVGVVVTATFLAEAWSQIKAHDYDGLRGVTGVAPVRRQTGKNKRGTISMRYACNHRLRNACYHWARVSTQVDAAARKYYAELRARGHSHGRALRSVADRWLRILVAMLTSRTLYNPSRFATTKAGGLQPASRT